MTDAFGTAALRAALLAAWSASPTRLREDIAAETDLIRGGYRDRVFTELVQNAADAAARAGCRGTVEVWIRDGQLHVANTGAPLDRTGVEALASLRASTKSAETVGRFGVGFTSVLAISREIEIRSVSGSVRFSEAASREALGGDDPSVPVMRLVWPSDQGPKDGFATEIVLTLDPGVDGEKMLVGFVEEAHDLLLELTAVSSISIDGKLIERSHRVMDGGIVEVVVDSRRWWQFEGDHARFLLPVRHGEPASVGEDVLRAPTRSDELTSLPVIVIGTAELQPDRRRILPGSAVRHLMDGYGRFAAALAPDQRLVLVPRVGLSRGEIDTILREAAFTELRETAWLPVLGCDDPARPRSARVLPGLTTELGEQLADTIDGLVIPELSGRHQMASLRAVDANEIGLARLVELLSSVSRPPSWWANLYATLEPLVVDAVSVEELGALPVPLADGRMATGPRSVVVPGELPDDPALERVDWVRLAHPACVHPLLARLGARSATPESLLSEPVLEQLVRDGAADAEAILVLSAAVGDVDLPSWLGLVELPDSEGALRPADELLLPDAPLLDVLGEESPFGTVDAELVRRWVPGRWASLGLAGASLWSEIRRRRGPTTSSPTRICGGVVASLSPRC